MGAYTITPSAVLTSASLNMGIAGEVIDAGEAVYLNSSDNKLYLAEAGDSSAKANVLGIAVNSADAAGQPVNYAGAGEVTVDSATFAVGDFVFLSATPGKIGPESDLVSTDYKTLIGYATAANKLMVSRLITNVQVPAE